MWIRPTGETTKNTHLSIYLLGDVETIELNISSLKYFLCKYL